MKHTVLLPVALLLVAYSSAQTPVTVSIGPSYVNQAYYSLHS